MFFPSHDIFSIYHISTIFILYFPHLGWKVPLMFPNFWKKFLVFPLLLFPFIIKPCSLKKSFLSLLAIFWYYVFDWIYLSHFPLLLISLHSSTIYKVSSDNHFAFLLLFSLRIILCAASCKILCTSLHSSSGTPLNRSSPLNIFVTSTANSYGIWFKSYLSIKPNHFLLVHIKWKYVKVFKVNKHSF